MTRKGWRGITEPIKHIKTVNQRKKMKFFGTVKAAVLEGSMGFPNLVASSIYETKPINYLSMVTEELKGVVR